MKGNEVSIATTNMYKIYNKNNMEYTEIQYANFYWAYMVADMMNNGKDNYVVVTEAID